MAKRTLSLLLVILAACAWSQQRPIPHLRYPTYLLNYPSLQRELGLSATVVAKITKIQKDAQKRYLGMISPQATNPSQLNRPTMAQIMAETEKRDNSIIALLSQSQRARLMQVGMQYQGVFALGDHTVFGSLMITPDQERSLRAAISKAQKDYADTIRKATPPPHVAPKGGVSPKARMEQMVQARIKMMKALDADAAKILTAKQMAKWKAMQGKPFPISTLYEPVAVKNAR